MKIEQTPFRFGGSQNPVSCRGIATSERVVRRGQTTEQGSAVLIVFALLVLMVAFVVGNNRTLTQLHRELRLIEQRQLKRFESASPTNRPPVGGLTLLPGNPSRPTETRLDAEPGHR